MATTFTITEEPKRMTTGERVVGVLLCIVPLVALIALLAPNDAGAARAPSTTERATVAKKARSYILNTPACTQEPVKCRRVQVTGVRISTLNRFYARAYAGVPEYLDGGMFIMRRSRGRYNWWIVNNPNTQGACGTKVPAAVCRDLGGRPGNG